MLAVESGSLAASESIIAADVTFILAPCVNLKNTPEQDYSINTNCHATICSAGNPVGSTLLAL
jgi:hypothetical protein